MSCFSCFRNRKRIDDDNAIRPYASTSATSSGGSRREREKSLRSENGLKRCRSGTSENQGGDNGKATGSKSTAACSFTFRELAKASGNFSDLNMIGEGGFGKVYKGRLESGEIVAVKQLNQDGHQGFQEFIVEVLMLSLLHHPNLVKLNGYCTDGDQRLLVYEYMPLGSLEDHLFDVQPDKQPLSWNTRLKIAAGSARGLEYLHCKANPPVIYRDLKSANILLDSDFNPKLSDFGLAKLGPVGDNTHVSTRVMGTYGYCAPEYAMSGKLTLKSDIYSFGVVLLEIITGRRAIDLSQNPGEQNLISWSRPFLKDRRKFIQLVDPLLEGRLPVRSLHHAIAIAAMCLQEQPTFRPLISDIVVALEYLANQSTSPDANGRMHTSTSMSSMKNKDNISCGDTRLHASNS